MFCEKEAFSSRSHFFHLECVRDGFPKNNCNLRLSREGRAYNRKSTSNQSTEFKPVECMMETMIKIMIKSRMEMLQAVTTMMVIISVTMMLMIMMTMTMIKGGA